jgi:ceramide glucosyltransferase
MSILAGAGACTGVLLALQTGSCLIAAIRCRSGLKPGFTTADGPAVSLVRTLCGVDKLAELTLESSFRLDYVNYEILFCVADAEDPVIPLARALIAKYPSIKARLLIGDDRISANPKLNNMTKGWRAASGDWVVFADSNLLLPRDYIQRTLASWRDDSGLVSAPPIGGYPEDFWGEIECGLLNTHQARWQYVVDAFGWGYAQGKTLMFRRADLQAIGYERLADEPAEDAAATKAVRAHGLRVRLARPPFIQPLGKRSAREVWARQLRWARLRRMTFPLLYAAEIFSGVLPPLVAACVAAKAAGASAPLVGGALLICWWVPEIVLARVAGWPVSAKSVLAWIVRDLAAPILWVAGWSGRRIVWREALVVEQKPSLIERLRLYRPTA